MFFNNVCVITICYAYHGCADFFPKKKKKTDLIQFEYAIKARTSFAQRLDFTVNCSIAATKKRSLFYFFAFHIWEKVYNTTYIYICDVLFPRVMTQQDLCS